MHGALGDRVGDNGRGPFDGVNLGHQGGVGQTGVVVNPLVGLRRVGLLEFAGNGVVLKGEQLVQHAQTQPPVVVDTGNRLAADQLGWQAVVCIDLQAAIDEGANFVAAFFAAAIQLRTIPPVGVYVAIGGWLASIGGSAV